MEIDYKAIGMRICNLRIRQCLTQADMAEACDVSTSFIGHIERGTRKASLETFLNICGILRISTDYVLRGISASELTSMENSQKSQMLKRIASVLDTYFDDWCKAESQDCI